MVVGVFLFSFTRQLRGITVQIANEIGNTYIFLYIIKLTV